MWVIECIIVLVIALSELQEDLIRCLARLSGCARSLRSEYTLDLIFIGILALLRLKPMSLRELEEAMILEADYEGVVSFLASDRRTIMRRLERMMESGLVKTVDSERYSLTEAGVATLSSIAETVEHLAAVLKRILSAT